MDYWTHAPHEKRVMHLHVRGIADGFCISSTEPYSPTTLFPLYLGIHIPPCLFSITNPIFFFLCTKQRCIELLEMPTLYLHSCQIHCLQSRCYFYHMLSRKQLPRAMVFKNAAIIFQICVLSSWQVCQSVCLGSSFIFPALAVLWSDLRASMWQTLRKKKKKQWKPNSCQVSLHSLQNLWEEELSQKNLLLWLETLRHCSSRCIRSSMDK